MRSKRNRWIRQQKPRLWQIEGCSLTILAFSFSVFLTQGRYPCRRTLGSPGRRDDLDEANNIARAGSGATARSAAPVKGKDGFVTRLPHACLASAEAGVAAVDVHER